MGKTCGVLYMRELVSVIMPVYNGEKFIKYAIESMLNQTYENWELILINDASEDASMKIAEKYKDLRIRRYANSYNRGIAYTRNLGLSLCRGKYICLLDDDDVFQEDKLKAQVDYLEENPQIDMLGGRTAWINELGEMISPISNVYLINEEIKAFALLKNPFWNCEVMFRSSMIRKYRYFYKDHMYGMEDYHFWVRYLAKCKAANLNTLVLLHRKSYGMETKRVSRDYKVDKERIFNFLRAFSLNLNGIFICDEKLHLLNRIYGYEGDKPILLINDAYDLYKTLKEICELAEERGLDGTATKKVCKDLFVHTLEMSNEMWWSKEGSIS